MPLEFQIDATCGGARAGRLNTPHGVVETPVFMPVGTAATVKGMPQEVLEELGARILLGNTYHLYLRPGVETVRRLGGLHRFMAWERALLTDSGGFQVFSLSGLRQVSEEGVAFRSHLDGSSHFFSPESATEAQIGLGADIIMAFDECTEYPAEPARVRDSMEMTARWAARCKKYFEEHKQEVPWKSPAASGQSPEQQSALSSQHSADSTLAEGREPRAEGHTGERRLASGDWTQALFGIVQGGTHAELRRESVQRTIEIGFDGYAIGGLSVGEPRAATREMVEKTAPLLPAERPRYLMGVGTPEEIVEYAALGVDMMDCVLPTRAARHGLLFTSAGRINIKSARFAQDDGPLDPACACRVCARYSRAYLRHLYASSELLAQVLNTFHNLAYYLDTMRRVRHSIHSGEFTKFLSGLRSRSLNSPAHTQREDPTFS
jgi:queuine tRNA-ribosyltransferase